MKITRHNVLVALTAASVFGASITPSEATDPILVPKNFTISGSGWGHGLGMSQYGAYGMALDNKTAEQILTHYYRGTNISEQPTAENFRVGLAQDKKYVSLRSEKLPGATGANTGRFKIFIDSVEQPAIAVATNLFLSTSGNSTNIYKYTNSTTDPILVGTGSTISITWDESETLINLGSGTTVNKAIASLGVLSCTTDSCSHRYRYGSLEIKSAAMGTGDTVVDLNVVNILRLTDQYLYGLGEMPSSWPIEALKSQVIAARSYAVKKQSSLRTSCDCNISTTDGDQVFVGFGKEFAYKGSQWKAAVNATKASTTSGKVIRSGTAIIDGFYSSSTGGKTQPRSEVWGTSPISWLTSVDDHWSKDAAVKNPNASWTATISGDTLKSRLGAKGIEVEDVWSLDLAARYSSGAVSALRVTDSAGNITEILVGPGKAITPDSLRTLLGIKSTYVESIKPSETYTAGSTTASIKTLKSITKINWPKTSLQPLDYKFKGSVYPSQVGSTVLLQEKRSSGWVTVERGLTSERGTWTILWKTPDAGSHKLRLVAKNNKGTTITSTKSISVGGKVSIKAPKEVKRGKLISLEGKVTPGISGVKVTIEKKIGYGPWKKVSVVKTDATGNWIFNAKAGSKKTSVAYRVTTNHKKIGDKVSAPKYVKIR